MTSTTGATGHPEIDEISDLVEGVLPSARATAVRHHLDGCEVCAEVARGLDEVRDLLGGLPVSVPMPEDVAERIDSALAAERADPETSDAASSTHVSRETPSSSRTGEPASLAQGGRAPASAHEDESGPASPVHEGGGLLPPAPSGGPASSAPASGAPRPAGRPRAATGPGRPPVRRRSGRRSRRTLTLGAVFAAAAIGLGGLLMQSLNDGATGGGPGTAATQPSGGGPAFSHGELEGQVSTLMGKTSAQAESGAIDQQPSLDVQPSGNPPSSTETASTLREPDLGTRVPECVQRGTGRPEVPLAAEQGTYEGKDAYLVVLPHPTDNTRVSAYVVDASCVRLPSAPAGKVLLSRTYPRH